MEIRLERFYARRKIEASGGRAPGDPGAVGAMKRFTRRRLLVYGAGGTALLWLPSASRALAGVRLATGPTLPATAIAKYRQPLVIPPAMPSTRVPGLRAGVDYYEIAVRQFTQQVLPPGMPATTVWSYGSATHPGTFHYPAFTVEARWRKPTRVRWRNELVDPATGRFLPHLLPVDPTLHWANPAGGADGRDMRPEFSETPGPYRGPVPLVTHLHGGERTSQESDGFAEAWYLPAASDIPEGYATTGSYYDASRGTSPLGADCHPGAPCSSTRTSSGRRRCGTTTTRSA